MPVILDLFLTFFKIGLFTFGGGYAMIPMIKDEIIAKSWLSTTELLDFIAVSESTPGPFAINMATFIGASQGGILGAIFATLGVVLPSVIIILLIAALLKNLLKFKIVETVLKTIRPIVVSLIIGTGVLLIFNLVFGLANFYSGFNFDWRALCIFVSIVAIYLTFKAVKIKISPIIIIIISALLGVLFYGLLGGI